MKIAIVGANLLGCATAHYLRRTQHLNALQQRGNAPDASPHAETFDLVLFEAEHALGGKAFRDVTVEGVQVEVGRTLRLATDLVYFPGLIRDLHTLDHSQQTQAQLVSLTPQFNLPSGIHPSSAVFNWQSDSFTSHHTEEPFLSALYKSPLFCAVLRIPLLFASFVFSRPLFYPVASYQTHHVYRAALALLVVALLFAATLPRFVLRVASNAVTAFTTTVSMVLTYSLSWVVARGAKRGVAAQLAEMRKYNASTSAVTVGHFLYRTGMGPWIKGSMADFATNKFKLFYGLVDDFMLPSVQLSNVSTTTGMESVTGLQFMLNMFTADRTDRTSAAVTPSGRALCDALVTGSDAHVRFGAKVTALNEDKANLGSYTIVYQCDGVDKRETFDGVVICCVPDFADFTISVDNVAPPRQMFGFTDDSLTVQNVSNNAADNTVRWIAIVAGELDGKYFGCVSGDRVPDMVTVVKSLNIFSVERIAKSDIGTIYRVVCGEEPSEQSDVIKTLFTSVRSVHVFRRDPPRYTRRPFTNTNGVDVPAIILSGRCVYAAALDRLACHPEMDVMGAMNAASLFSQSIQWKSVDEELDRSRGMRAPGPVEETEEKKER